MLLCIFICLEVSLYVLKHICCCVSLTHLLTFTHTHLLSPTLTHSLSVTDTYSLTFTHCHSLTHSHSLTITLSLTVIYTYSLNDCLCRSNLEVFAKQNFWFDLCRTGVGRAFFYHMKNAWSGQCADQRGLAERKGKSNDAMNKCILMLCKEYPLSLLGYSKNYMRDNGAGDLFHLKPRIIRCMAENIVR